MFPELTGIHLCPNYIVSVKNFGQVLLKELQLNQKQNLDSPLSPSQLQGYVKEQKSHPRAQTQGPDLSLPLPPLLQTPLEVVKQICISDSPSAWIRIRISVIITVDLKVLGKYFNIFVPCRS